MKKNSSKSVGKVFAEVTLGLILVAFVACLCLYIFDAGFKTSVNNLLGVKTKTQLATVQAVDSTKNNYADIYDKINDLENFDNSTIEIVADIKSDLNDLAYIMDDNQKFTVEELDAINLKLETIQNKLDALIQSISSENFLINSEFIVNQRGATSYSGTGSQVYTVDRWFTEYAGTKISTSDSGIVLTSSSSNICTLAQIIENNLDDYTMVFSIKLSDGSLYYVSSTIQDNCLEQKRFDGGYIEISKELCNDGKQHIVVRIVCNPGTTLTVEYAKLEIGSIPTPFTPKLIGDEQERCHRYYFKTSGNWNAFTNAGGIYLATTTIPTKMRAASIKSVNYANAYMFSNNYYLSFAAISIYFAFNSITDTDITIQVCSTGGNMCSNFGIPKSTHFRVVSLFVEVDGELYLS